MIEVRSDNDLLNLKVSDWTPGQVIKIHSGRYNAPLVAKGSGEPGKRVRIIGDVPNRPVMLAEARIVGKRHIQIDSLSFEDSPTHGLWLCDGEYDISLRYLSFARCKSGGLKIDGCIGADWNAKVGLIENHFEDCWNFGLAADGALVKGVPYWLFGIVVDRCGFKRTKCPPELLNTDAETGFNIVFTAVGSKTGASTAIRDCTSTDAATTCYHLDAFTREGQDALGGCKAVKILRCFGTRAGKNVFEAESADGCTFEGNTATGAGLRAGYSSLFCLNAFAQGNIVKGNILYGPSTGPTIGIRENSSGTKLYHNTVLAAPGKTAINVEDGSTPGTIALSNIFRSGKCSIGTDQPEALKSDYNCLGPKGFGEDWSEWTLAQWQVSPGQDKHSISADPQFVDPARYDYHLMAGSPCIGKGHDGKNIGAL